MSKLQFYNGFMTKCAALGLTTQDSLNLWKEAMVDPSILGIASTKLDPKEYYKRTGQLLDKGKSSKVKTPAPVQKATKKANLLELAEEYRIPQVNEYFCKCAEEGINTKDSVMALLEHLGLSKKADIQFNYNYQDPFVALADCMLQIGSK